MRSARKWRRRQRSEREENQVADQYDEAGRTIKTAVSSDMGF